MKPGINLITFNIDDKNINFDKNKFLTKNTFLIGEWCKNNKNYYLDNKVKSLNLYNYSKLNKKTKDAEYILKRYKELLKSLSKALNEIHNRKYSERYWEILLSRWLFTYLVDTYTAWQLSESAFKRNNISKFYQINFEDKDFIPSTTLNYHLISARGKSRYWFHWTIQKILSFKKKKNLTTVKVPFKKNFSVKNMFKDDTPASFDYLNKNSTYNVINICLKKNIFFFNLAFSKFFIFKLMKKNFFINYYYIKKVFFKKIVNKPKHKDIRKLLKIKIYNKKSIFEKFISNHIIYCLPEIFLEDYDQLEKTYDSGNWPKKKNLILTSFGQYWDEAFKIYCAKQINKGSKLYIFQHGYGLMFADNDFYGINIDKKISDKFFTWGNNKKNGSHPFFYAKKIVNKNKFSTLKEKKEILLIIYGSNESPTHPINGFISGHEKNLRIVKYITDFNNIINNSLKKNLRFRIFDNSKNMALTNSIKFKLKKFKTSDIKNDFNNVIQECKLSVHFFLGSAFLEALFYNVPTILILDKKIHINFDDKFNRFIKEMTKVNMIFSDPHVAANFINNNSNNLNAWWNNNKLQNLVKRFCKIYCDTYDPNQNQLEIT